MIYFFEMACAISGYILDVNPFDQPGVEAYKKNMFALLNKPGFEEAGKKLKERLYELNYLSLYFFTKSSITCERLGSPISWRS